MLPKSCLNVDHQHWGATLPQHSYYVSWTLFQHWSPSLGATLLQCSHNLCLNVVPSLVTNIREQRCHNVHTALPECCLNVSNHCWGQCCHKSHTTLPQNSYSCQLQCTELHTLTHLLGITLQRGVGVHCLLHVQQENSACCI